MGRRTRRELLQEVLRHVRATGDTALPWEEVPGLAAEFRDREELLTTLHRRWYARFTARLDGILEDPPPDQVQAVQGLWSELTTEHPEWRAVLDAYREHPAVAAADEQQRRLLAMATYGAMDTLPSSAAEPDRKVA